MLRPLLVILVLAHCPAADPATAAASRDTAASAFHLDENEGYARELAWLIAHPPSDQCLPDQWLSYWEVLYTSADDNRQPDLALAIARRMAQRWPFLSGPHIDMARQLGNLGQFQEALAELDRLPAPGVLGPSRTMRAEAWRALWLWQSGRHDEARKALPPLPTADIPRLEWHGYLAIFHAACDGDAAALRADLTALKTGGFFGVDLLRDFRRDIAFDQVRGEPWFINATGGHAAADTATSPLFHAPATASPYLSSLPAYSGLRAEIAARGLLVAAADFLAHGDDLGASRCACKALILAPLPEAHWINAEAAAHIGRAVGVGAALNAIDFSDVMPSSLIDPALMPAPRMPPRPPWPVSGIQALSDLLQAWLYAQDYDFTNVSVITQDILHYHHGLDQVVPLAAMNEAHLDQRWDLAEYRIGDLLAWVPDDADALYALATVLFQEQRWPEVVAVTLRAGRLPVADRRLVPLRAEALMRMGRIRDATGELRTLDVLPFTARDAVNHAIMHLSARGWDEEALELQLRLQAVEFREDSWGSLAEIHLRLGRLDEALDDNHRARGAEHGDSPEGRLQEVAIFARQGRTAAARAMLAQVPLQKLHKDYSITWSHAMAMACLGDEAALESDLADLVDIAATFPHLDSNPSLAITLAHDSLLAPWRDRLWLRDLIARAGTRDPVVLYVSPFHDYYDVNFIYFRP